MVAPTRTPQVRGVKCDLCKKILSAATWLDQTKPAKSVDQAQQVLDLIREHENSGCPCMPKNIEYLLVGSTHFEIHRIVSYRLDGSIHSRHCLYIRESNLRAANRSDRQVSINDLQDNQNRTRFKLYNESIDSKLCFDSDELIKRLCLAIDSWDAAMRDQGNPFNSKLALRLGLTHHIIYACYLFKYHKLLVYQLISANLLLNLFKCVEGVTNFALVHAHYLMIRTLLDCDQVQLAKQYLRQAAKIPEYQDKTHYESILLACVECELSLIDSNDTFTSLDDLAELAVIKPDDKLQHYYARTLALSVIARYIHKYPARSDLCFEFYTIFRYISAIIRRCYEGSFDLILSSEDGNTKPPDQNNGSNNLISGHNWIRFASCDFSFTSFDLISKFYIRAGQPEALELLFNGLNLVAQRTCSLYWRAKIASIGSTLDSLCDEFVHAESKLQAMSEVIKICKDNFITSLLQLDLDLNKLSLTRFNETKMKLDLDMELSNHILELKSEWSKKISTVEIYDMKSLSFSKIHHETEVNEGSILTDNHLKSYALDALKHTVCTYIQQQDLDEAVKSIVNFGDLVRSIGLEIMDFHNCQCILEIMLMTTEIDKSDHILIEAVKRNRLFLRKQGSKSLEAQLSSLTIQETNNETTKKKSRKTRSRHNRTPKSLIRARGIYDVAIQSEENLDSVINTRYFDPLEAIKNFQDLSSEEIVVCFLRHSEPNPDYLLYRRANEMMFRFRLNDQNVNHDALLYHFSESIQSNTMRYRWMMFEEQHASLLDGSKPSTPICGLKNLSFCNGLANHDKSIRQFLRSIPEGYRILQIKTIPDLSSRVEHLLVACFDGQSEPFYCHLIRDMTSDDFFESAKLVKEGNLESLTLSSKFSSTINEARKTLLQLSSRMRCESRQKIEHELGNLLRELEDDCFGPFRFMFCGKTQDTSYRILIDELASEIDEWMLKCSHSCVSRVALKMVLENSLILSRDEFCQVMSSLYECPNSSENIRWCFNKWLKSVEEFISSYRTGLNRSSLFQVLPKSQIGLILDAKLEQIPFESIPLLRVSTQGVFRIPSLRLFSVMVHRESGSGKNFAPRVDPRDVAYVLDPANNLAKTRQKFEIKLRSQHNWIGTIGKAPETSQLESWLSSKQIFMFIGHGAGMIYYNKLRKGRGLSAMSDLRPVAVVMGCSSGRVASQGPRLESFGVNWLFLMRGGPSYIGLLWDVTDTDIDRFFDAFIASWLPGSNWPVEEIRDAVANANSTNRIVSLATTEAVAKARQVCQYKFLVGSTPVIYGLPTWTNCLPDK